MDYQRTLMLFEKRPNGKIATTDLSGTRVEIVTGQVGPSGLFLSSSRPKTTINTRAKITSCIATLRHILEGRIIAFESKQGLYFEKDGARFFVTNNGTNIKTEAGASIDNSVIVDAISLFDMSSLSGMVEMQQAAHVFLTNTYSPSGSFDLQAKLFHLCDAQYFEGLKIGTRDQVFTSDNLQIEEIKQAIRTGELRPMKILLGLPAAL